MRRSRLEPLRPYLTKALNHHHAGAHPDIAIISSPRSGSTWLMELLCTQKGMTWRDEPDHNGLLMYHGAIDVLTRHYYASLTYPEQLEFKALLKDDRRTRLFGPSRLRRHGASLRSDRRVLKLLRMALMADWLEAEVGLQIVYLVRHPIPQALSCMARGHHPKLSAFLGDASFWATHLGRGHREHVEDVMTSGDVLEQFVTQWCLENVVPLRAIESGRLWYWTSYEHIVTEPQNVVHQAARALGLSDVSAMRARLRTPSKTSNSSAREKVASIGSGQGDQLLGLWREHVDERREKELLATLTRFGLDTYSVGQDAPTRLPTWPSAPLTRGDTPAAVQGPQ